MCCEATKFGTKQLKAKMLAAGGKMSFWKVVSLGGNSLVYVHTWNAGVHKAEWFDNDKFPKHGGEHITFEVDDGIHVYLDRKYALSIIKADRDAGCPSMLLEVTCDVKHLIGAEEGWAECYGNISTAVFSQVEVTPKQWSKFKKCKSDYLLRNESVRQALKL